MDPTIDRIDADFRGVLGSPAGAKLAARTSKRPANAWREGACLVLAEAVVKWLGETNATVWHLDWGMHVHIYVRVGDFAIDGGGVVLLDSFRQTWTAAGFDFASGTDRQVSISDAERLSIEFDDYATERLVRLLTRAIAPARALSTLKGRA
jgi:hypothetical protein